MAKRFLTGRGLARLDGCSPTTVITAKLAGRIVANGHGRFDVEHPKNAAWLRRVKQSKKRETITAEMRLDAVVAKVERLEFDCALACMFYMPRSAVEAWMSAYADLLTTALLAFPRPYLVPLLWNGSDAEREKFGRMVHDAMAVHVDQMGDLHHAIRHALDDAAAAYRDYRMEPPRGVHIDIETPEEPATLIDAERRRSLASAEFDRMMVDRRRGVLLAREAVRKFAVGTVLDWRNKVMEGFSIRNVPQLRGAMGCRGDAGANHRLHLVLQHALRSAIVIEVEHAAMDEARTVVGEEAFWKVVWPLAGQWLPPIRLPALPSVGHHVKQSTITPAQRTVDGGDGGRRGETVDP